MATEGHLLRGALEGLRERAKAEVEALRMRRRLGEVDPRDGYFLRDLSLAYQAAGDEAGARQAYCRAMDAARKVKDERLQAALLRICRLFLNPDTAERHLRVALALARRGSFQEEETRCLNNLGVVLLELRRFEEARECFGSAYEVDRAFSVFERGAPLVNLASLALATDDHQEAERLLSAARERTAPETEPYLRCLEVILRACQGLPPGGVEELDELANAVACQGDPALLRSAGFTLARALLVLGYPERTLRVALAPPFLGNDEKLARASFSKMVVEIFRAMGRQARRSNPTLTSTTAVQAWLYRLDWVPPLLFLRGWSPSRARVG